MSFLQRMFAKKPKPGADGAGGGGSSSSNSKGKNMHTKQRRSPRSAGSSAFPSSSSASASSSASSAASSPASSPTTNRFGHRGGGQAQKKLQKVDVVLPPGLVQSLLHGASFRVGVFGDRNTGKSSLINRIAGNAWAPELRGVAACQVQWRSSTQQQHVSGDAPATLDVQEIKDTLDLLENSHRHHRHHAGAEVGVDDNDDVGVQRRRSNLVAFRESLLACDAIVGVYDPTRRASFDYVKAAIKLMVDGLPAGAQQQRQQQQQQLQQQQQQQQQCADMAFVEAVSALPPLLLVSNFKDEEASKQHSVSRVLFAEAQDYASTLRRSSSQEGPAREVYVTEASCVNCYGLARTAEFLDIPFLRAQARLLAQRLGEIATAARQVSNDLQDHCDNPEPYEPNWTSRMKAAEDAALEAKYYSEDPRHSVEPARARAPESKLMLSPDQTTTSTSTSRRPAHSEPESSFSEKTAGLPQQFANPEQYARDHPMENSTHDLHTSEPGDADPFGAENDVGASFVGGKAVPLKTAEDFAVSDDGKFSSFLVDSSDDEDAGAGNPSLQPASTAQQSTTSAVATNSFFNDSSDDDDERDGASTLPAASAPAAAAASTQSANSFFADDSDSDADSTGPGPAPSVAAPKVRAVAPASSFFQDDDSSDDDAVTSGPAPVPQTALDLAKTAAGGLYDDDSDSEGDILSALSASQSPLAGQGMPAAPETSKSKKDKSSKKKDKKKKDKNAKDKGDSGVASAPAVPASDVFAAFNEPIATNPEATDAGSVDLTGFLSTSTPDAAETATSAKKDKKEKKKKEKKKKEKKKKKKKSKEEPTATTEAAAPAVKASSAAPSASSALGSFYDDDSDSD